MFTHPRPRALAKLVLSAALLLSTAIALEACSSAPTVASGGPAPGSTGRSTVKPLPTPVTVPGQTLAPGGEASRGPSTLPVDAAELAILRGPWQPTPLPIFGDFMGVVDRVCRAAFADALEPYELQIVDARGDGFVNAFFIGMAGGIYACEGMPIDPSGELQGPTFGSGGRDPSEGVPQPGPDEVISWYGTHQEAPRSIITAAGLVGSNVAQVRITAAGKPDIVATLMNGWFAAWFPDDWPRITLRGYDTDGTEVFATLDW